MSYSLSKFTSLVLGTALGVTTLFGGSALDDVMKERGLTQADLLAAAKTYTPSGGRDKYIVFSSGRQSGQIMVYGVPSMRILKYIGGFTPEPWQGWGYDDDTKKVLAQGNIRG
jgi:nitrous-oxide reductase